MARFIPWFPFVLMLSLAFLNACGLKSDNQGERFIVGHWGHLTEVQNTWAKPTFLIHHPKDQAYNVCLDQQMNQAYPGIQEEIVASINIWGHYIGRKINVVINLANLDEPLSDSESVADYTARLWRQCPRGTNIVVGQKYQDPSVGVTGYNSLGQRGLFLKTPDDSAALGGEDDSDVANNVDDEDGVGQSQKPFGWVSFRQVSNESLNADQLLDLMVARNRSFFVNQENNQLTLRVLVHEFGHVWGLCDQYVLTGGSSPTNCDPRFASVNGQGHIMLHQEALMSSSSRYVQAFLSDDDIQGIRSFLDRANFIPAGYPVKAQALQTAVAPVSLPAIEFASIESVRRFGSKIEVRLHVRTSLPASYSFSLSGVNSGSVDFSETISSAPLQWTPMIYNLGVNGGLHGLDKVTLKLKIDKGEDQVETKEISAAIPAQIEREIIVIR